MGCSLGDGQNDLVRPCWWSFMVEGEGMGEEEERGR